MKSSPSNNNKQRSKPNTKATRSNMKGTIVRTQSADRPALGFTASNRVQRISSRLSWPADDCMTVHFRSTRTYNNPSGSTGTLCYALDPTTITTTGYTSLGAMSPMILAMSKAYSRFMVTKTMVKVTLTTPITNGGYIGLGYTPDNAAISGPPNTLADATGAVHSDVSQVGTAAIIQLDPSDYFVDWRPTLTGSAASSHADNQAGVVQVYASAGNTTTCEFMLEIDTLVHFAGFRYNP